MRYILKRYKNGNEKTIGWSLKPVSKVFVRSKHDALINNHIGEYWYTIEITGKTELSDMFSNIFPGTRTMLSRKYYFLKTLKALKKAINRELKKSGLVTHFIIKS